ncbi:MAG TPA: DUF1080 domain-containing protein [Gemmata sp.]|jgi:hypothetical protein|nr:DUF1080 domain-containing protein [Gemmata sp.]
MRFSRLLLAIPLLAVAALFPAPRVLADDSSDFLKPENWEGLPGLWKIDGSTIIGETKEDPKFNNFFCSKKKYGDFELTCKVLLKDEVGNSGIQVRSALIDEKKFVVAGPQVDVGKGVWGSLYGERVGGYQRLPKKDVSKPTEYNDYDILVKGNHITIKLNDEITIDEDFPDNKGKNPAPAEGIIAFQIHAGYPKMYVEFKDIKFKDLSKK